MRIIAIDDEQLALKHLGHVLRKVAPDAIVEFFADAEDALAFVGQSCADIALLDIEMPGMDGITLAEKLLERCPLMNIICVTGHKQYALDAFSFRASGYLMKPVLPEALQRELKHLRNPLPAESIRLRVQTFGNFEVFAGDDPLKFARSKTKELFAYLVDRRGASASSAELISILWEDRESNRTTRSMLHNLLSDLSAALCKAGAQDVLIKRRNSIAIRPSAFDCDYYAYLEGNMKVGKAYRGEYMRNYSWAEFTLAEMDKRK